MKRRAKDRSGDLSSRVRVVGSGSIHGRSWRENRESECRTCGKTTTEGRTFCAYCGGYPPVEEDVA